MTGGALFSKFGKQFNTGEIIFCEFEPGNSFYLIQTGRIKISKVVKDKEKTMDILGVGDIFGEMAILEEQRGRANEERIRRMRTGQIDRAMADHREALARLARDEARADILARRVAAGVIRVEG